jgi:hypothetical protein
LYFRPRNFLYGAYWLHNSHRPIRKEEFGIKFQLPKKIRRPGDLVEMLLLTIVLGSTLLFVVWQLSTAKVEPNVPELNERIEFLGQELSLLSERYERSKAREAVLERETDVVRRANHLLREQESQRQAELGRLQAELDFYSRLAGTGGEQKGLSVYQIDLVSTQSPRVFQFVLTLTQNIRRASIISGKVRIDMEGTVDDSTVTLYWSQLTDDASAEPKFRFKYFQQLEGYLSLPENFNPTRLLVTLDVKDRRKSVSRTFEWRDLLRQASEAGQSVSN